MNAANPSGAEVGTIGLDGSGRKKLFEASDSDACGAPLSISSDGKALMLGRYGAVFPTDGGEPWQVLVPKGASPAGFFFLGEPDGANSRDMSMSADGTRFVFLSNDGAGPR